MFWKSKDISISVLMAELQSIKVGLQLAIEVGVTHVALYTDCQEATTLLNGDSSRVDMFTNVLHDCRVLCRRLNISKIRYVSRRDNAVADLLAKEARSSEDEENVIRTFPQPPIYICNNFIADCNNFVFPNI